MVFALFWSLMSASSLASEAPPVVTAQIDWQSHPTMHFAWPWLFSDGLKNRTPKRTWKHQFKQVMHTPFIGDSGVRIHLAGAMAAEAVTNRRQARRMVLDQFYAVERWVEANSDRYALAKTPEEARRILATSNRSVVIHSIEGARFLLEDETDAQFWRDQGVALVTLIHLYDDSLGGSGLIPGALGRAINPKAVRKRKKGLPRGLTDRGKQAIVELADAGILVDLSHMSPESVVDSLEVTRQNAIPPVFTHGKIATIGAWERGITDEQIVDVYQQGGTFNLAVSALSHTTWGRDFTLPEGHCLETLDDFRLAWDALRDVVEGSADSILGEPYDPNNVDHQVILSSGWSGDWNGWTNHSKPVYGKSRCHSLDELPDPPLEIDTLGLAHPGLLPQHWQRQEEAGMDLTPMLYSSERFLDLWEQLQERSEQSQSSTSN